MLIVESYSIAYRVEVVTEHRCLRTYHAWLARWRYGSRFPAESNFFSSAVIEYRGDLSLKSRQQGAYFSP